MPRDLSTVIGCLINLVPATEASIHASLRALQTSTHYTAPEQMVMRWKQLIQICEENIGEPKLPWQLAVSGVVSDQPVQWQ